MTCWWHHWHRRTGARHLTVAPRGRCLRPQKVIAYREQCCRCEALRWTEWNPAEILGGPTRDRHFADARVLEVGEPYAFFGVTA